MGFGGRRVAVGALRGGTLDVDLGRAAAGALDAGKRGSVNAEAAVSGDTASDGARGSLEATAATPAEGSALATTGDAAGASVIAASTAGALPTEGSPWLDPDGKPCEARCAAGRRTTAVAIDTATTKKITAPPMTRIANGGRRRARDARVSSNR